MPPRAVNIDDNQKLPVWEPPSWRGWLPAIFRIAVAVIAVAALSGVMLLFRAELGVLNVMLLYIILSFALGFALDARSATVGAVLSFLSYDLLFIPPLGTFTVADPDHVLGLFVFLAIAIGTSLATARIRERTRAALRETERTTLLYDLNRSLVSDVTLDQLLNTIAQRVVEIYGSRACRILTKGEGDELGIRAVWPMRASIPLDRQAAAMAQYAIGTRSVAGVGNSRVRILAPHGTANRGEPRLFNMRDALFVPITVGKSVLGVLEVVGRPGGGKFTADDQRILTSFADQVALAMERASLTEEATRAAILDESDRLKSAMLAAVSHDLRTPLAAIKASASTLLDSSIDWPATTRNELLEGIEAETDRLTLMVSNLLDLSRIEGGALHPQRDWHDITDLIHDSVRQAHRHAAGRKIVVRIPDDPPIVWIDYVEIAQVMTNLLGNAIKYSAESSTITVRLDVTEGRMLLEVEDEGIGIPPERLPHIFETFYRVHEQGPVAGSGIGLAICKGLVEAHGGTIWATSQIGIGTTIHVDIPVSGGPR